MLTTLKIWAFKKSYVWFWCSQWTLFCIFTLPAFSVCCCLLYVSVLWKCRKMCLCISIKIWIKISLKKITLVAIFSRVSHFLKADMEKTPHCWTSDSSAAEVRDDNDSRETARVRIEGQGSDSERQDKGRRMVSEAEIRARQTAAGGCTATLARRARVLLMFPRISSAFDVAEMKRGHQTHRSQLIIWDFVSFFPHVTVMFNIPFFF